MVFYTGGYMLNWMDGTCNTGKEGLGKALYYDGYLEGGNALIHP